MKPTLKAIYGILAALDLALHNGGVPIRSKAIARRQNIPARFLEQILNVLKKAGLVESHRGAQGGYVLRKTPSDVSLAEIVEALEGPFTLSPTAWNGRGQEPKHSSKDFVLSNVFIRLRQAELDVLSTVTLKDLVNKHQELEKHSGLMYHI